MADEPASTQNEAPSLAAGKIIGLLAGVWALFDVSLFKTKLPIISTVDRTLLATESGAVVTNKGASGAIAFTLPAATVGLTFSAVVLENQQLRLNPNNLETIALTNGVQQAAGKYITADAKGETIQVVCLVAGTWDVMRFTGTWTVEP